MTNPRLSKNFLVLIRSLPDAAPGSSRWSCSSPWLFPACLRSPAGQDALNRHSAGHRPQNARSSPHAP